MDVGSERVGAVSRRISRDRRLGPRSQGARSKSGSSAIKSARCALRGVTILLDKDRYAEGDVLKARLVADQPGATVLLTQEVGNEILRRDVYKIDGQSREISIPIDKARVPNFFLAAALVQDYEVFQAQTEVFVPPVRQLLDILL